MFTTREEILQKLRQNLQEAQLQIKNTLMHNEKMYFQRRGLGLC